MLLSEGQMSDYNGAALMLEALPSAKALLGDRGYDADWFEVGNGLFCVSVWDICRNDLRQMVDSVRSSQMSMQLPVTYEGRADMCPNTR